MKNPTRLLALFALLLVARQAFCQNPPAPSKEMRGAWIASVANIDWPSKPGLDPEAQRAEFDSLLNELQHMGMNAVFVQVRPAGDALYPTKFAPWSRYLTGKQGVGPEPYYDPLDYMVTAAHKRRMEFHAWFNPYRATTDLDTSKLAPNHLLKLRPDWAFRYGNKYFFNPGIPSVRANLVEMIGDVVTRYDIDGVHFDDYFYPYPEKDQTLNDYKTYQEFGQRDFRTIEDWRRNNVDEFVRDVAQKIRSIKPYVRFGISPFGVWRNADRDPNGSPTRAGINTYDDLYADVLNWLDKGWIDYAAPQIYWSIGFPAADYEKLVDWWGKHAYGKHIYVGHAAYKIGDPNITKNDPNWGRRDEINRQVYLNRGNQNIQGSIFFSTRAVLRNPLGVADSLAYSLFEKKALVPGFAFKGNPPAPPQICRAKGSPSAIKLAWQVCSTAPEDQPYYFAVYRFIGSEVGAFTDPENLMFISPYNPEKWWFEDRAVQQGEYYTYVVTAFNRSNIESFSSEPVVMKKTKRGARRVGGGWWSRILQR